MKNLGNEKWLVQIFTSVSSLIMKSIQHSFLMYRTLCKGLQIICRYHHIAHKKENTNKWQLMWWCLAHILKSAWESQNKLLKVKCTTRFHSAALSPKLKYTQFQQCQWQWPTLPNWLRTVLSQNGFCRVFTGYHLKKGSGSNMFGIYCKLYHYDKFLKRRLKLETEFWPYWSPIHRYISTLRVMKQMNYFFVSLDSVCFLGLFLPIRIDT